MPLIPIIIETEGMMISDLMQSSKQKETSFFSVVGISQVSICLFHKMLFISQPVKSKVDITQQLDRFYD